MKLLTRALLVLLLGLLGVLPVFGEDGGEGAGGTGIWILPTCRSFASGSEVIGRLPPGTSPTPRAVRQIDNLTTDLVMQMSPEVGAAVAMVLEGSSAEPIILPVNGSLVRLGREVVRTLVDARVRDGRILILDGDRRGYSMSVRLHDDLLGVDVLVD